MTVQQKPNDPPIADMTWAEAGPSTYDLESEEPIKPTDQLVTGYGKQEPLPHAQFNWLFRSVMRWIRWLVSKVDSHVHDGLGTDASAPRVKASQHLDWGAGGSLDVTSTGATHEITHAGSAGTKRIVTGQLHAPTHVRTPTIQANGQGITAAVNVRDTNGAHGFLDSAIVKSTNYLQTPTIRNTASGGTINVRDSGGGTTTLNVNALTTTNVTATNVTATTIRAVTSGATAAVNVRDSGGTANGFLNSAIIQTTNYLQTPTIRSTGTSDQGLVVNVRNNSNADNAILNASIVQTATIRNKDTGTSTQMRFRDSVGNDNVRIDARNAPYCLAKINAFGTPSFIRNYGFNNNSLSRISNITAGGYVLSFDTSDSKSSDDIMIFINPENQSNFLASVRIESDTIISIPFGPSVRRYFLEVRIRDISSNNNLSNSNFSILVYVH